MNLGKYIKAELMIKSLSIRWLADQLDINEKTLAGKLNRNSITGEDLLEIGGFLEINMNELKIITQLESLDGTTFEFEKCVIRDYLYKVGIRENDIEKIDTVDTPDDRQYHYIKFKNITEPIGLVVDQKTNLFIYDKYK
ncbi:hypothetical protein [Chengkuizengella marina]|uniref:Uncharacterized protein n=1 Tax=Chengkuizengella marina TaxID=2507566 RepID=A0A6N9Q2L9_9BACL|nr:hypothetical protein [Chengkuizengella marina]NBI28648.1 hypothetical protein [Chengkuizengella marina]